VLLLHQLAHGAFVPAVAQRVRVRRPFASQNLATDVDERLDVWILITAVLRLDVEDPVPMLDIGVVSGDHGEIVARGSPEDRCLGEKEAFRFGGPPSSSSLQAYR
jgi:hypothetical protein